MLLDGDELLEVIATLDCELLEVIATLDCHCVLLDGPPSSCSAVLIASLIASLITGHPLACGVTNRPNT